MPEHCTASTTRPVRAQICFSDELPPGSQPFELPDGCMMMEIELDELTLIVIRPQSMDRRLYDEWNRFLDRVTTQGNWVRNPARQGLLSLTEATAPH